MLDLFWSAVAAVTQVLLTLLPDSPFSSWLSSQNTQATAISNGLGWLNWLVDVNAMKILLGLYLVAITAYYAVTYGISTFGGISSYVRSFFGNLTSFFGGDGS